MSKYIHNIGTFIGKGANEIFFQRWDVPSPKAKLIIVHGIGEHSGRYSNIIKRLEDENISIFAIDHKGHGNSGGKRGHVDSFSDLIYDLKLLINFVKEDDDKIPLFLLGHSLGGVISTKYALEYPDDLTGLILSAPGITPAVKLSNFFKKSLEILSKHYPKFTSGNKLSLEGLSRDQNVIETYKKDPLVHDRITARFYQEFANTCNEIISRLSELKMPLLVFHGKKDIIVDYSGSEIIYKNVSSKDKEIHLFEDLFHETMNEPKEDRQKVLDTITKWLRKRIKTKKKTAARKTTKKNTGKKVKRVAAKTKKKAVKSKTKKKK